MENRIVLTRNVKLQLSRDLQPEFPFFFRNQINVNARVTRLNFWTLLWILFCNSFISNLCSARSTSIKFLVRNNSSTSILIIFMFSIKAQNFIYHRNSASMGLILVSVSLPAISIRFSLLWWRFSFFISPIFSSSIESLSKIKRLFVLRMLNPLDTHYLLNKRHIRSCTHVEVDLYRCKCIDIQAINHNSIINWKWNFLPLRL